MATTVAKAFDEFADKIKPTQAQSNQVSSRRGAVEGFLKAKYGADSTMPLTETKVIGSAGRQTLIRPVDDVDVFCVFDDSQVWSQYAANSQQLLYRVKEALDGYSVQTVGSRGQAVRLFYSEGPNVDITPAFPVKNFFGQLDGYYIPKGDGGWQQTNPYKHAEFMSQRNQELGGNLKKFVRFLKRWNNVHSRRLKSFHLEVMAQAAFATLGTNSRQNFEVFFGYAANVLDVNDPAGYSGNLAGSLTYNQREAILQSFTTASEQVARARAAEANGDTAEAIRQWRIVLGSEFPSYG